MNKFETGLDKREANHRPLTPLGFLGRAADTYPDRLAVIHGARRWTWKEHEQRCRRLAGALVAAGVERGDTVAIFSPNTSAMLEAQFGVPMSGAVLNSLNSRLDAAAVSFILRHSEARVLLVDAQLAPIVREALASRNLQTEPPLLVVDIEDDAVGEGVRVGTVTYEDFLAGGDPATPIRWPESEWDAITLNYTSGTTGDPKGVVYHHRGAYLNALGQIINAQLGSAPAVYLWTLPMFHCNGWCFPWALAAVGATQVCIRKVSAEVMYENIAQHGITLMCGAPTVLGFLADGAPASWKRPATPIRVYSGGSSPPAPIFRRLDELGFEAVHLYGMTEMHGVATLCEAQDDWTEISAEERLQRRGRQGVGNILLDELTVADAETLEPVPRDGKTMGEILMRGNIAMKGYLKNPRATEAAFAGGWYHTGDLAVRHPDGYLEIKDRSKDVIISGGENISSIEIEECLYTHPDIAGVAVVAVPDKRWGETPCAIVELKPSALDPSGAPREITEAELIGYCRERLAAFKCPRHVIFETLTRTATGKLQKFRLRASATARLTADERI